MVVLHGMEKKMRNTFLQISDCNWSIRLHKTEDDSITDFVDKLKLLNKEIRSFITHLEKNL